MAAAATRSEQFASDINALAEMAAIVCFAPCLDRPSERRDHDREQAAELLGLVLDIKAKLDELLTDDVRAQLVELLDHFDRNRERYRLAVLRWVDLLEEIAHLAEGRWGDGTGVLKKREVRAAIYYLVSNFFGPQALETVPPWLRPIVLEVLTRVTVEFLVTLDNPADEGVALWDGVRVGPPPVVRFKATRVRWAEYRESVGERFVGQLVRLFMPRPAITPALRARVDPILAEWAERNRLTGTIPVERAFRPLVETALWIGRHGNEVRSAIDAVAMATYAAARFTELDKQRQLDVIKEAVVLMFEELGYTGPVFRSLVRFMVEMMADATENLFRKRGII